MFDLIHRNTIWRLPRLIHVNEAPTRHAHVQIMAKTFSIIELSGERLAVAFPLINAALPEIALSAWQDFTAPFVKGRNEAGGVLGTMGEGGYLCGVVVYRRDRDLRFGAVLTIDLFIALDFIDRGAAVHGLLQASETMASELGCNAVRIRVGLEHAALAQDIGQAGYRPDAQTMAKTLAQNLRPN